MFTTLFSSEVLVGALVGFFTLMGVLINAILEVWKEARRERRSKLSEMRKELGLDKGVQESGITLFINSERSWWSRFLLPFGIILSHPDLSGANLMRVNLAGKNLSGVNFAYANLTEADLSNANLKHANFRGAILIKTNFDGAKYHNTSFWESIVYQTPGIHESAFIVGITNLDRLETNFGRVISSPDILEKLLNSIGVDTKSVPVKRIYWAFKSGDQSV